MVTSCFYHGLYTNFFFIYHGSDVQLGRHVITIFNFFMAFGSWFFYISFLLHAELYLFIYFPLHQFFILCFIYSSICKHKKIFLKLQSSKLLSRWPLWNWCSVNEYGRFSLCLVMRLQKKICW